MGEGWGEGLEGLEMIGGFPLITSLESADFRSLLAIRPNKPGLLVLAQLLL